MNNENDDYNIYIAIILTIIAGTLISIAISIDKFTDYITNDNEEIQYMCERGEDNER